jgi:hypothetical protein
MSEFLRCRSEHLLLGISGQQVSLLVSNPHRIDIFIGIQNTLYNVPVLKGEKFTCEIFSSYLWEGTAWNLKMNSIVSNTICYIVQLLWNTKNSTTRLNNIWKNLSSTERNTYFVSAKGIITILPTLSQKLRHQSYTTWTNWLCPPCPPPPPTHTHKERPGQTSAPYLVRTT